MRLFVKLKMSEHDGAVPEWFYSHPHRYLRGGRDGALEFHDMRDALKECAEIFHHHIEQAESVTATVEVVDYFFLNGAPTEATVVSMDYLPEAFDLDLTL